MSFVSGTTGGRIGQLLDAIDFTDAAFRQGGITAGGTRNTTLDTGDSITVPNADGDKTALAMIEELLAGERGVFYMSKDGRATFEERTSRARRRTSVATITDYALISQPGFEYDQLVNRQSVQRVRITSSSSTTPNVTTNETPQVAVNDTSVRQFGVQDGGNIQTLYVASDSQAQGLAQYIVNIRSSFVSPTKITIDNVTNTSTTSMLSLELQDRVTLTDTEAGTSGDYIIEAIEHEITNAGASMVTTYTLSEYGVAAIIFAADAASTPIAFAPPDGSVTYTECTSNSRPSSPANGDYIFETDTGRYYERVSGAWVEQVYPRFTY